MWDIIARNIRSKFQAPGILVTGKGQKPLAGVFMVAVIPSEDSTAANCLWLILTKNGSRLVKSQLPLVHEKIEAAAYQAQRDALVDFTGDHLIDDIGNAWDIDHALSAAGFVNSDLSEYTGCFDPTTSAYIHTLFAMRGDTVVNFLQELKAIDDKPVNAESTVNRIAEDIADCASEALAGDGKIYLLLPHSAPCEDQKTKFYWLSISPETVCAISIALPNQMLSMVGESNRMNQVVVEFIKDIKQEKLAHEYEAMDLPGLMRNIGNDNSKTELCGVIAAVSKLPPKSLPILFQRVKNRLRPI